MAQIRNVSGEPREVPWESRTVEDGELLNVPDADVWSYTQQDIWEPADTSAQTAHDAAGLVRPRGNDSRDVWAAWVLGRALASETDITDLSRDDLRDTYGQEA